MIWRSAAIRALVMLALSIAGSSEISLTDEPAIPAALAILGQTNYIVTPGNGSWSYSFYSNGGNPNGNDNGQGDHAYPTVNLAFATASSFPAAPFFSPSTATVQGAPSGQSEMPISRFLGINGITFPSKSLGVAVGSAGSFHLSGNDWMGLSILHSVDGGLTWMRASGVPWVSHLTNPVDTNAYGQAGTVPPWPMETANDLCAVHFTSRTVGYAVGGNDVTLATVVSTSNNPLFGETIGSSSVPVGMGALFKTTNGGSVWKNVPIYPSRSTATSAWVNNDKDTIKAIYTKNYFPGVLFGIGGTSNGKYLYAVGAPGTRYYAGGNSIVDNSAAADSIVVDYLPTILYSADAGNTWVSQKAPMRSTLRYTLFDVSVAKGSTAIAVGGSATINFGGNSRGAVIATTNGGFTWTQVYPLSTVSGATTPSLTCVSHQPHIGGVQRVWVGGYVTITDQARVTTYTSTVKRIGAATFFPVAANVLETQQYQTRGLIHTVLLSLDDGRTFTPAPFQIFPSAFVQRSFGAPTVYLTDYTVYGIEWENSAKGWLFGKGFILSTSNFGITWVFETPEDVATLRYPNVKAMGIIPSSR